MRQYLYHIKRSNPKRWNLYIEAKRTFSLSEMLAKQHWVLGNIADAPIQSNFDVTAASCVEIDALRKLEPISSAFHYDSLKVDRKRKSIVYDYGFVLEFVFRKLEYIKPFLEWLQKVWKGDWIEQK